MNLSRKSFIIKTSIDNFIVAAAMSITASILSNVWDMMTVWCIPFSFALSWILTLVIPSGKICNWFSGLFKIKPNTVASDLVGGLLTNVYITAILSFACKTLVFFADWSLVIPCFLETFGIMYAVSYVIFEASFYLSMKLGIFIDKKDAIRRQENCSVEVTPQK